MRNPFEKAKTWWVRYSDYQWRTTKDGMLYIQPAPGATFTLYNAMEVMEQLVLDALNAGRQLMGNNPNEVYKPIVMEFVKKYGLLGMMTALPTTPKFMDYEMVYLPKNRFIKEEHLHTEQFLLNFFPFEKPHLMKSGKSYAWSVSGDNRLMALSATFSDDPLAVTLSFMPEYAERFDWIVTQLKDWMFLVTTCEFFYDPDYQLMANAEEQRTLLRQAMNAFSGNAPTYRITLFDDAPALVWDFHSLMLAITLVFSFMLTDTDNPIHMCKNCGKVFIAEKQDSLFCSVECKTQYRAQKKQEKK